MQDDRFERWLRDEARSYHEPPQLAESELDAMWAEVESRHFDRAATPGSWWTRPSLRIAAALVLGVGIGRLTLFDRAQPVPPVASVAAANTDTSTAAVVPRLYEATTTRYFGQAAALLVSLPSEVRDGQGNTQFIGRANDLLLTTRLLLDSPAADDPKVRGLLNDLELVLAQIVRLRSQQNTTDLDLINQALEQRDVMPRLRTAVA